MKAATHIKPISYLKSHAADIVNTLTESREPMLITQNGEARLVVMDVQSWEDHQQTLALLKILSLGQQQIHDGHYRPASDVFADLDALDAQQQP